MVERGSEVVVVEKMACDLRLVIADDVVNADVLVLLKEQLESLQKNRLVFGDRRALGVIEQLAEQLEHFRLRHSGENPKRETYWHPLPSSERSVDSRHRSSAGFK